MTNGELQDWLQEFGRHLPVIVEDSWGHDLVVNKIDSTEVNGELVICISVGSDVT